MDFCWWVFFSPPLALCFNPGGCGALIHISMSQACWITALPFHSASPAWQCCPHHKAAGDHGRITVTLWSGEALCLQKHIKLINGVAKLSYFPPKIRIVLFFLHFLQFPELLKKKKRSFEAVCLSLSRSGLCARAWKCLCGHRCLWKRKLDAECHTGGFRENNTATPPAPRRWYDYIKLLYGSFGHACFSNEDLSEIDTRGFELLHICKSVCTWYTCYHCSYGTRMFNAGVGNPGKARKDTSHPPSHLPPYPSYTPRCSLTSGYYLCFSRAPAGCRQADRYTSKSFHYVWMKRLVGFITILWGQRKLASYPINKFI